MKWFSKNKKDNQIPSPADMTPLQAVTHLCAVYNFRMEMQILRKKKHG